MTNVIETPDSVDAKIQALFDILNKQKAEVEAAEKDAKRPWKTNCSYNKDPNAAPINIQTASEKMITMLLAESLMIEQHYAKAAEILGSDPVIPSTYKMDDWLDDFKKRIAIINLKAKKEKLTQLETRLNAIVSPDQRRAMELAEITKSLGV